MTTGAAVERTRLAWRRTMLVTSVVAIVMVVAAVHGGISPTEAGALTLGMLVWLGFLILSQRRIRALNASTAGDPPEIARTVTLAGLAIALLATLGLVLL
ncbi:uncharacterized membrane protein YidH (DUF202 family) [Allocatelliglobosispora scoriae]|uniref:Uncharacterized membrane protein YidH (DUF202 family) n=1 Tax=Allocatelliglobosispora scoriae TaxID=643052 RepID=A0A841BRE5_9ACTN|nr:DUF202 domain-containing protein [Allocatelliglobosispora scoriae]MBB5869769.1 uncharacterized membrane protein YidH (DUF202 family) [Allocatelliglobosispora scoriae]